MALFSWKPFSREEEYRITAEIREAEAITSGEIRVHIDKWCKNDPYFKARNIFARLKMHETDERNGVLIYVALLEKKFAIIGDEGIDQKVRPDFWHSTALQMEYAFRHNKMVDGICMGIAEAGKQLSAHFPGTGRNRNELSDEISYGS